MPPGSLIPRDVRKKLGMFEKLAPKEVMEQLRILSEAERSFVIPVRLQMDGEEKYFIMAGMLLSEKVPVQVSYDEVDIQLIQYALDKAKTALAQKQVKKEEEKNDTNTESDEDK
jgi:hypothetical protein